MKLIKTTVLSSLSAALLVVGCDVQKTENSKEVEQAINDTPTKKADVSTFASAIEESDVEGVKNFIKNGVALNTFTESHTYTTPLNLVAESRPPNFLKIARLLIQSGADVNARAYSRGGGPLHSAGTLFDLESDGGFTELLIESGADVNVRTEEGASPLHFAVIKGSVKTVDLLINNGADVNLKDNEGNTPLMFSEKDAYSSNMEKVANEKIATLLRNHGATD